MRNAVKGFVFALSLMIGSAVFGQTTAVDSAVSEKAKPGNFVRKIFDRYLNDTTPPGRARVLVYPTLAYAPETSFEFGAVGLLLYNARNDTLNRLSEMAAFVFATLNKQYGAWFDHYNYTNRDAWFFLGRVRYQHFPLLYYGIGPYAGKENETLVEATSLVIRERVLRRIVPNFFAGVEVDYQHLSKVQFNLARPGDTLPPGAAGSRNIGLGFGLVYDSRHNALNVRDGLFAEAAWLGYRSQWGSEFAFNNLTLDVRKFVAINKRQVFAAQVYAQSLTGDVPFNQMALAGGDALLRGYYYGRYRDKNFMAAQAEYRWLPFAFSKRFGAAVFAGAGRVAPTLQAFGLNKLMYSGGAGLRFLVFPRKDIFVRLDAGLTREGINFYFYTGEAF